MHGLPRAVCERIIGGWRSNRYRKGDNLFYQGNEPLGFHFLCRGMVKLVRTDGAGRQHILRIIAGPGMLGERALLAGQAYAASAQAVEDSGICTLVAADFQEIWRSEPEFARLLARRLAVKLAAADEAACDLAQLTVRELLAKFIIGRLETDRLTPYAADLPPAAPTSSKGPGQARNALIELHESRQELADLLGTSAEVISRTLSELERKRLIAIEGRRLKVLDQARLRSAARLSVYGT